MAGFNQVVADYRMVEPAAIMMPSMINRNTSGASRRRGRWWCPRL